MSTMTVEIPVGEWVLWNTGRLYEDAGQLMAATVLADGRAVFADLSRGIEGEVAAPCPSLPWAYARGASALRERVMRSYDGGSYRYSQAAFDFMRDVNLRYGREHEAALTDGFPKGRAATLEAWRRMGGAA